MVSFKLAGISAVALVGLMQMCPAPIPIVAAVISGVVGGGVSAGIGICAAKCKRAALNAADEMVLPPGVNQHDLDLCTQQINNQMTASGVAVDVYNTTESIVRADNVPPACMTLATVLSGVPAQAGGPVPIPMGSASLEYHDMTAEEMVQLQGALNG